MMRPFEDKALDEDWEAEMNQRDEWLFEIASFDLKCARRASTWGDISHDVNAIRDSAKNGEFALADIGTSEEELLQLTQTGYKSEAQACFEVAQNVYGCSHLKLYLRAVRNSGRCFWKERKWYWFEFFLQTVFCRLPRCTRQDNIARVRKYLAKANLSPADIGTDEVELVKLGS